MYFFNMFQESNRQKLLSKLRMWCPNAKIITNPKEEFQLRKYQQNWKDLSKFCLLQESILIYVYRH
jgi:hypothetical protein